MGIAKGQDPQAEELLQNTPLSLCLSMPSICFVEALTTREEAEKYQLNFLRQVDIQINEAEQDYADNARFLVTQLEEIRTSYLERNNKIQERFDLALNQVINQAEIITLNADIIQAVLNRDILQKHIVDKIILQCILPSRSKITYNFPSSLRDASRMRLPFGFCSAVCAFSARRCANA